MQIEWKTRLCTVNDKLGYFHAWEHYSKPLEASPLIGGAPAGVFSKIFGIVEFSDGVRRVDPTDICFCDEENQMLSDYLCVYSLIDRVLKCIEHCATAKAYGKFREAGIMTKMEAVEENIIKSTKEKDNVEKGVN